MLEAALLGAGRMAAQLAVRLQRFGGIPASELVATHYNVEKGEAFFRATGVRVIFDNLQAARLARRVILAVRPQDALDVLREISSSFTDTQRVLISIVAGSEPVILANLVRSEQIICYHPTSLVFATSAYNPGLSLWCPHPRMDEAMENEAKVLLQKSVGDLLTLTSEEVPFFVFAAGNSPGYLARILQAFASSVRRNAPSVPVSTIYRAILFGLYRGMVEECREAESIWQSVATRQGVTQEGLRYLEQVDLDGIVTKLLAVTVRKLDEFREVFRNAVD